MLLRLILTHDETILRHFTTQCNVNVVKYSLFNRTVVGTGVLVLAVTISKKTSCFISTLYSVLRHNIDRQVLLCNMSL